MNLFKLLSSSKPDPGSDQLPEQKELGGMTKWAATLGAAFLGAWCESFPAGNIADVTLPKELVGILLAIILLLFVSTRERPIYFFSRWVSGLFTVLALGLFFLNGMLADRLSFSYFLNTRLKGLSFSGPILTESAANIVKQHPQWSDSTLLYQFHGQIESVWLEPTISNARQALILLFVIGAISLGFAIVSAFDVYKLQGWSTPPTKVQPLTTPPPSAQPISSEAS